MIYELPLGKQAKTAIIDVWRKFENEFGCKLSVRGRRDDSHKKARLQADEKIQTIKVKLVEKDREKQSAEERLRCLEEAEVHVDAFARPIHPNFRPGTSKCLEKKSLDLLILKAGPIGFRRCEFVGPNTQKIRVYLEDHPR